MKVKTISESSRIRVAWDGVLLLLIVFSCVLIPYSLVFQSKVSMVGSIIVYLIDLAFLSDVLLNFFTTFRREGTEVADFSKTVSHYRKTFLSVDLIGSLPLDIIFLFFSGATIGGCSAVLVLRLLRLLRIGRLFLIFRRWEGMSWINPGHLRIAKFISLAAILMHL